MSYYLLCLDSFDDLKYSVSDTRLFFVDLHFVYAKNEKCTLFVQDLILRK